MNNICECDKCNSLHIRGVCYTDSRRQLNVEKEIAPMTQIKKCFACLKSHPVNHACKFTDDFWERSQARKDALYELRKLEEILKPCPFCGSDKLTINGDDFGDFAVICDFMDFDTKTEGGCGATTGYYYKSEEKAVEAWNTRASALNASRRQSEIDLQDEVENLRYENESLKDNLKCECGIDEGCRLVLENAGLRKQIEDSRRQEDTDELISLIQDLTDSEACRFDHHGYCQAHGWMDESECPHHRATKIIVAWQQEKLKTIGEGK